MNTIHKELKNYLGFLKVQDIFLQVFEVFLGLAVGAFSGALISDENPTRWVQYGTIISFTLLVLFVIVRLLKASFTPNTAIDYLETKERLNELTSQLERKQTINGYIDKAIQSLNLQTCPLTIEETNHLCDNSIDEGIKEVLQSIIQVPNYILDSNTSKFTVAVHLPNYPIKGSFNDHTYKYQLDWEDKTMILRDDFKIGKDLSDDILVDMYARGLKYQIQNGGRDTYNNGCLKETLIKEENKDFKLITSPIPAVCEDSTAGVLFLFCDKNVVRPVDLENTLLIFGRIMSNWISKYEECISNREYLPPSKEKRSISAPPEAA